MEQISQNCFLQKIIKLSLDKISKIFSKILPIYWAFLTYMLLKPGEENHEYWFMFSGIDKVLHLSIFAALGFLSSLHFPRLNSLTFFRSFLYMPSLQKFCRKKWDSEDRWKHWILLLIQLAAS